MPEEVLPPGQKVGSRGRKGKFLVQKCLNLNFSL